MKSISRKEFLKISALITCTPLLFSNIPSCTNLNEPQNSEIIIEQNKIEEFLSKHVKYTVKPTVSKSSDLQIYSIPNEALIHINNRLNKFGVLRQRLINNELYIQTVVVKIISNDDNNYFVTGIIENDIIYLEPNNLIKNLYEIDRVQLRKRFLRIENEIGL